MVKIKKVEWLDAREMEADIDMLKIIEESIDGTELLCVNETFGEVTELPGIIIVTTEKCSNGTNTITIIPRGWVISIK